MVNIGGDDDVDDDDDDDGDEDDDDFDAEEKIGARLICNQGAPFVVFCAGRLDADHT